jgi:poly(3-hydroxyalkanoate) synthetase
VPWKSAYLSRGLLGGETTFVMGASGHIAGVINPPAAGKRSHWRNDVPAAEADEWLAGATEHKGSWWPHWIEWLKRFAGDERAAPKEARQPAPQADRGGAGTLRQGKKPSRAWGNAAGGDKQDPRQAKERRSCREWR